MYNDNSNPTIENCTFFSYSASVNGGGMYNLNSSPTITGCIFTENESGADGAGIYNRTSSPIITDCIFIGHSANSGAGMYNYNGSNPAITNCLFSGNIANFNGGSMVNNVNCDPTIVNCTFSSNTANLGGGLFNDSSSPATHNSIFWNNSDSGGMDESAQMHTISGTPTINYSNVMAGWTGSGSNNINADPLFVDADGDDNTVGTLDDNLRLQPASPCHDAGNNAALPGGISTDLDGNARIVRGTIDMGAYESKTNVHNLTQATDYFTLQAAINAAVNGNEIEADPITYKEAINFLGKAISLRSTDGPESTIIDASSVLDTGDGVSVVRCITGETAATVLDGFTITGGIGDTSVFSDPVGGGMFNHFSSPTVLNCRFNGNSAMGGFGSGGGMFNNSSSPTVANCTFSSNTASFLGGGMVNTDSSSPIVTNCTFNRNTAAGGAAMSNTDSSNPAVTNCIFWSDTPDEIFTDSSMPTIAYSNVGGSGGSIAWNPSLGTDGGGNLDVDPLFVYANEGLNDNLRLCHFSQCIDVGDNSVVIETTDPDGNPRITNTTVDMGAYENPLTGVPSPQTFTVTNENDSGPGSLRQAILQANSSLGADTVEFDPNGFQYRILLRSALPIIIDDLTIDGGDNLSPQVSISGGSAVRAMQVSVCATVNLIAVRIHHGEAETGAGVFNEGVLDLVGCWVEQNSTAWGSDGGGIYNAGTLTFENGGLSSNFGEYGGGIYNAGTATITDVSISLHDFPATDEGGAIYNTGELTVNNCDITRNIAYTGGGAISNKEGGDATIEGTAFTGNSANFGGAINNRGTIAVTNCTFGDINGDPFYSPNTGARGGAIYNGDEYVGVGVATISMCTFEDNRARVGGGIENRGGTMTVEDCTFDLNVAAQMYAGGRGGGISNMWTFGGDEADLTVINCRFRGNSSRQGGGGIDNEFGTLMVIGSTFSGNVLSAGAGAGIRNMGGNNVTIINSTFSRNTAIGIDPQPDRDFAGGGGIWSNGNTAGISNCIFSDNHAEASVDGGGSGGGLMLWDGTMTVTNCTFVDNDAEVDGGGMYCRGATAPPITNNIFWNNVPSEIAGGAPVVNYSDVQGGWAGAGANNINVDPLFVDPNGPDNEVGTVDDNLRLLAGSPCIDAGDNTAVPVGITTDLAGRLRFVDDLLTVDTGNGIAPIVDMGVYEHACAGNLDAVGSVDMFDFALLAQQWMNTDCGTCDGADFTGDNNVTVDDLFILAANWLCGTAP
jgi:hypothetical protein